MVIQPTGKRWKEVLMYSCKAFWYFYSSLNFKLKLSVLIERGKLIDEICLQKVMPA